MDCNHRHTRRALFTGVLACALAASLMCAAVPASAVDDGTPASVGSTAQKASTQLKQSSLEVLVSSMAKTVEANIEAKTQAAEEAEAAVTVGEQAVATAKSYIGVPYVSGGASPSGFDCSGLTMYVYAQLGISLPHNAQRQYNSVSTKVSSDELQVGDLVFFGYSTSSIRHVGIYVGDGLYIHAPQSGESVKISSLSARSDYVGAVRPSE